MQTSKLGIYVDLMHLLEKYYPAMFQMNKKDRVILGDKILDAILDCIGHTAMANSCPDECLCLIVKEEYNRRNQLNNRYNLKPKHHDTARKRPAPARAA